MKTILKDLKRFWKLDFSLAYYLFSIIFLSAAIYLNYEYQLYKTYINTGGHIELFFRFFLFFAIPYFLFVALHLKGKNIFFNQPKFWYYSLFFLFLLALNSSCKWYRDLFLPLDAITWSDFYLGRLLSRGKSIFLMLIPLTLFILFHDRAKKDRLGINTENLHYRPYLFMALFMLPLLLFAATQADFLKQYPSIKMTWQQLSTLGNPLPHYLLYTLIYAFSFFTVELLFRGALVVFLKKEIAQACIMPMVVIYVMLHFGKPAGEAISSAFGGYILGVIAYYSGNIWGGVFIHVFVAIGMDTVAIIAKQL